MNPWMSNPVGRARTSEYFGRFEVRSVQDPSPFISSHSQILHVDDDGGRTILDIDEGWEVDIDGATRVGGSVEEQPH